MSEPVELEGLPLEDLRTIWRERFGAPPSLRSTELLGLMLAWRIQAERDGGLDRKTRLALSRRGSAKSGLEPTSGTRLTREWEGVQHEVTVMADGGFVYRGNRYRSLSEVARVITGVRWNGPRFFGLRAQEQAQ
jgi:hypothetical protein